MRKNQEKIVKKTTRAHARNLGYPDLAVFEGSQPSRFQ